jgi:hypothetical protein
VDQKLDKLEKKLLKAMEENEKALKAKMEDSEKDIKNKVEDSENDVIKQIAAMTVIGIVREHKSCENWHNSAFLLYSRSLRNWRWLPSMALAA